MSHSVIPSAPAGAVSDAASASPLSPPSDRRTPDFLSTAGLSSAAPLPRPNLLYLTHRVPYPPDKGDRIRTYNVLRQLARTTAVHLACLADEPPAAESLAELHRLCKRLAIVPLGPGRWLRAAASLSRGRTATEGAFSSAKLRRVLHDWARETAFDVALVSASSMAPYLTLPPIQPVPAVIDLVDVDSEKWLNFAAAGRGLKSWLYHHEGRRLRRLEGTLLRKASAVTLVSEEEAALLQRVCGPGPIYAICNGVDLEYFRPQPCATECGCVFVGALDYPPNVDAATWFARHIWPTIHRRFPSATFRLVGRRPSSAVHALARLPGVEVIGQVPDVRPYLAAAAAVVVPLRLARGVQNKVLEALAMAKAVVVSPQALEGLRTHDRTHLLKAATPQEWCEAVGLVLTDPALRHRLGEAGRRFVEEHHCWERCLRPLTALVHRAAGGGA